MRTFFGDILINKQKTEDLKIKYPIKVEYYKTTNEENNTYGIEIIKKEYKKRKINTEQKAIMNLTNDENKIEKLLNIFKENKVTIINAEDIIEDIFKSTCKI